MTTQEITIIAPQAWSNDLETLPFKGYGTAFEAKTASEVIDYLLSISNSIKGDEAVEAIYEKEVFYAGEGWEWEETTPSESTRVSIRLNSEIANEKTQKRVCVPVSEFRSYGSGNYGGYKDYA